MESICRVGVPVFVVVITIGLIFWVAAVLRLFGADEMVGLKFIGSVVDDEGPGRTVVKEEFESMEEDDGDDPGPEIFSNSSKLPPPEATELLGNITNYIRNI